MTNREKQLKAIIRQMLSPLRDIPLDIIIEAITGEYTIWPYDGHARQKISDIAQQCLELINDKGIVSSRPNEVGNYCEPYMVRAIRDAGGKADIPVSSTGKRKSVGYPDIEAEIDGKPFYIEVKSYNERNANTTQRSFYLSPSPDFKITQDAYHLIFAFRIANPETLSGERVYKATHCTVLDAHNLPCDVKYEFNSDNRRLYGNPAMVVTEVKAS